MTHKDFQTETPLTKWWPLFVLVFVSGAVAVLASLKGGETPLPWWYSFLLRLKIPSWIMFIIERPWFITGAMAIFFLSKLAVVAFLTAQLVITRRKLSRLIEAYQNLQYEHDKLKNVINIIDTQRPITPQADELEDATNRRD
jgi:hypothetical protein